MHMRSVLLFVALQGMLLLSVWLGYSLLTATPKDKTETPAPPAAAATVTIANLTPLAQVRQRPLAIIQRRPGALKTRPPEVREPAIPPPRESALLTAIDSDQPAANATSTRGDINVTLVKPEGSPELPPIDLVVIIDVDGNGSVSLRAEDEIAPPPNKPRRLTAHATIPLYQVQAAAFRNEERAVRAAALLQHQHKSRLRGVRIGITPHDAGSNGTFWRVVSEEMSRGEAVHLCNVLRSAGQDCILRPLPPLPKP